MFQNEYIKKQKSLIIKFLWDNKPLKLNYSTLIQPIEKCGLNLIDLKIKTTSMQNDWIKHYCHSNGTWKAIATLIKKIKNN